MTKNNIYLSKENLAQVEEVREIDYHFDSRKVEKQKKFEELRKEHKRMVEKSKEYAMRQHIKHVDEGKKYHKYC
ncbi:4305_t:CDS:2, partial [Funneliformis geosporum]